MDGFEFGTESEKDEWEIYNSTIAYWANISSLKERAEVVEVDFMKDSPET